MQSHSDFDYAGMVEKANRMRREGSSRITGGAEGEPELDQWFAERMNVIKRPDDEHGVLRCSIAGGVSGVDGDYCVFRGPIHQVIPLLERAVRVLKAQANF